MRSRTRPAPYPGVLFAWLPFVLLLLTALASRAAEESTVEALKREADQWIELEVRAAQERNAWHGQKEILAASIEVLKRERTQLHAKVEANEVAAGLFRARIDKARADLSAQEAAHAMLGEQCAAFEARLRALAPRLPEPLQERIRPQLERLAAASGAPDGIGMSERAQLVISALTAIDQFNNSLTLTHHLRKNGNGETVDVKVLYWGLAMGYGIDAQGRHAWLLRPGPAGWEWQDAGEHLAAIGTMIRVRERETPEFVVLPMGGPGGAQ